MTPTHDPVVPNTNPNTDRELIDNLYDWLHVVLNRLDQIENPGMEPQWPEPFVLSDDE